MKKDKQQTKKPKKEKFDAMSHWKGMPEFNQTGEKPIKTLKVHFKSKEDMLKFSKLVNQEITSKLIYIWYPKREKEDLLNKRWSD